MLLCSKARDQADELAQIEADANSHFTGNAPKQQQQQQQQEEEEEEEEEERKELSKTRSDRRLPVRPPPKATDSYSEATHALDNIIREQERQMAAPHAR